VNESVATCRSKQIALLTGIDFAEEIKSVYREIMGEVNNAPSGMSRSPQRPCEATSPRMISNNTGESVGDVISRVAAEYVREQLPATSSNEPRCTRTTDSGSQPRRIQRSPKNTARP